MSNNYTVIGNPEYVGCYCIGGRKGLCIYFTKKPKWFHRKMMYICLGWEWLDGRA